MDDSINKSFIPEGTVIWKGIEAKSNIPKDLFAIGKTFSYKGFNSFTLSPDVAKNFADESIISEKGGDQIIIEATYKFDGKGLCLNNKVTINLD